MIINQHFFKMIEIKEDTRWIEWFRKNYGREPTKKEIIMFGTGFIRGWNAKSIEGELVIKYKEIDNLENDL